MARPLRIELSGGLYHVTSRGNGKEAIYLAEADRKAWLAIVGKVCERYNWVCHAYCQMSNHYHLVIETPEGNLSKGMRHLNGVYTQYINRTHQRTGHVFQGRYKAVLVEKDSYLLELARYVVLNPVRAGLVKKPEDWPWSSYNAMMGQGEMAPWLQTEWMLGQFGKHRRRARVKYEDFVRAGVGLPSVWEGLQNQIFLGSERFITQMQNQAEERGDRAEIPQVQRRREAKPLAYYANSYHEPKQAMVAAYRSGAFTLKAIADYFGVHYSTVSRAVRRDEGA